MLDRRQFMQVAAATAVLTGTPGKLSRAAARQTITQDQLLKFQSCLFLFFPMPLYFYTFSPIDIHNQKDLLQSPNLLNNNL